MIWKLATIVINTNPFPLPCGKTLPGWVEPPRPDQFPAVTRIRRTKSPGGPERPQRSPWRPENRKRQTAYLGRERWPSCLCRSPGCSQPGRAAALMLWGVFAGEADRVPGLGQHAPDECPDAGKGALHHARPEWQPSQAFHHGEW